MSQNNKATTGPNSKETVIVDFLAYAAGVLNKYDPVIEQAIGLLINQHSKHMAKAGKEVMTANPSSILMLMVDKEYFCKIENELTLALIYGLAAYLLDLQSEHGWPLNETLLKFLKEEFHTPRKEKV